jgi:hypothetical protein
MSQLWKPQIEFYHIPIPPEIKMDFHPNPDFSRQIGGKHAKLFIGESFMRDTLCAFVPIDKANDELRARTINTNLIMCRYVPLLSGLHLRDNATGGSLLDLGVKGLLSGLRLQTLSHLGNFPTGFFGENDAKKSVQVANRFIEEGGWSAIHPGYFTFHDPTHYIDWFSRQFNPSLIEKVQTFLIEGLSRVEKNDDNPALLMRIGFHQQYRLENPIKTIEDYGYIDESLGVDRRNIDKISMQNYIDVQRKIVQNIFNSWNKPTLNEYTDRLRERLVMPLINLSVDFFSSHILLRDVGLDGRFYDFEVFKKVTEIPHPPRPNNRNYFYSGELAYFKPKHLSWLFKE